MFNFHLEKENPENIFKPKISKVYRVFGKTVEIEWYYYDWYWIEISIGSDFHGFMADVGINGFYFCWRIY